MASTYSPNLRIELIGTGDQSGTWGDTTNTNLGSLIEQAIAGYVAVDMVDADYTLSELNGSVDQSRNATVEMTSSGSLTATRNVIIPPAEKQYVFKNSTTGGQSLVVKVSGQTGVTVPNGKVVSIFCDGTTTYVSNNYFPSLTLGAALPVTSGGTGTTTSTGSGNVVLSTSPTLVTPALGTPASGTLTNCTGLPVASGISGLGAGVSTFLATPSSANLASAVSDETGSGSLVFATSPTLVTPVLGTPASGTMTNCTGLPIVGGTTGTLSVARGGTGVTTSTGSGNVVLSASPTLTGTVTADTLTTLSWIQAITDAGGGFGVRIRASSGNTANILQFTNNAANAQWASLVATNGLLSSTTDFASSGTITAANGFVGNLTGTAATATTATTANALNTSNSYTGANFTATGSLLFGASGSLGPGAIYSDANWGCIIRAKQASPAIAEFSLQSSTGTERLTYKGGAWYANGGVYANGRVIGVSPNSGSSGGITVSDAPGNPNAAYIQATNNSGGTQYGSIHCSSSGWFNFSGSVLVNDVNIASIGVSQSYSGNLYGSSRFFFTTYTNTTGRPIFVSVTVESNGATTPTLNFSVNGAGVVDQTGPSNTSAATNVCAIVPSGSTYQVNYGGGLQAVSWQELR